MKNCAEFSMGLRLLALAGLCGTLAVTAGCGPEKATVTAPPPEGVTPAGESAEEYNRKMQEQMKGGGPVPGVQPYKPGAEAPPGAGGAPPGPGGSGGS